jgi:hypothetical protein
MRIWHLAAPGVQTKTARTRTFHRCPYLGRWLAPPAGLPLASELFDQPPQSLLSWADFKVREVPEAFRQWRLKHPDSAAEKFVGRIYSKPFSFGLPGSHFPFSPGLLDPNPPNSPFRREREQYQRPSSSVRMSKLHGSLNLILNRSGHLDVYCDHEQRSGEGARQQ